VSTYQVGSSRRRADLTSVISSDRSLPSPQPREVSLYAKTDNPRCDFFKQFVPTHIRYVWLCFFIILYSLGVISMLIPAPESPLTSSLSSPVLR
jgi:hypothetical protein